MNGYRYEFRRMSTPVLHVLPVYTSSTKGTQGLTMYLRTPWAVHDPWDLTAEHKSAGNPGPLGKESERRGKSPESDSGLTCTAGHDWPIEAG